MKEIVMLTREEYLDLLAQARNQKRKPMFYDDVVNQVLDETLNNYKNYDKFREAISDRNLTYESKRIFVPTSVPYGEYEPIDGETVYFKLTIEKVSIDEEMKKVSDNA